jgi:hypothetical protein
VTYRWGLPEDTTPLLRLIDALAVIDLGIAIMHPMLVVAIG